MNYKLSQYLGYYNTYDKIEQEPSEFTGDLGGLTKGVALKVGQEMRL
jgi:hypothetical protein